MKTHQDFEDKLFAAVELHRNGRTKEDLIAIEQIYSSTINKQQRQSCLAEMKNLHLRLEWQSKSTKA